MKGNELRQAYLKFFESKQHLILDSFSLIPENDPSLLLIGAGMAPLKPFFTGKLVPPRTRVTTCQKCIRTGDIENVGRTARHHTFFEMLGNFSFGDYFKKEAIHWAWEFLTEVIKLDKNRLYVTVYPDDQEAYDVWHNEIGLPDDHISRLEDNFWEIGEGPCGPDSEIFYDLGEERGCGEPDCAPGCDCDRYLEIWNLVFTQFNRTADGEYVPLEKKNIDTGAGLERLASVLQNKESNFETDLIFPIIEKAAQMANVTYHTDANTDVSLKVIGDHVRAISVLISDGVLPSNEGRGYVLRRILRRAVRHGRLLGIEGRFLTDLVDVVIDILGSGVPGLTEKHDFIKRVVANEEDRFNQTLAQGLELLSALIADLKVHNAKEVPGTEVFKLYDTYGFPWELTEEIAMEAGLIIDMAGFENAMAEQRARARAAREDVDAKVATPDITFLRDEKLTDDESATSSEILMLGEGANRLDSASDGMEITLIVRTTPFHAEGGGQLGDSGFIVGPMGKMEVHTTRKLPEGTTYHVGTIVEGNLQVGDTVSFEVDTNRRLAMARNHTATHLLHAALKQVLGSHVNQAGSLVMPDRLRFDFTHFSPVTADELQQITDLVNGEILKASNLTIQEMSMDEAKKLGAMALFGEKYGDRVRVVTVPEFSVELCGGSHVVNTAVIGTFRILSEGGIGSGVRRIEAVTGEAALALAQQEQAQLREVATILKTKPEDVVARAQQVVAEVKQLEHDLGAARKELMSGGLETVLSSAFEAGQFKAVVAEVKAADMDELRSIADMVRDKVGSGIVLLGMKHEDKVNFVCMATKDAVKGGFHAGNIVKATAQAAGGNGGGRPDMAQAGGKEASALGAALEKGKETILSMVK
ncbi:alanine--tRNA ligase [Veillonella sp. R32]|uniref:alanine--tRNA ligase n=1 Tax=Veillonella sp. R32 TaxID=2021312 RepID=UPI0013895808|nr:alanine--tRNA ligase [Veillonella sp. R32]KAF1683959.1 alanine--tRNA ligase [Veillonella sp. R32]